MIEPMQVYVLRHVATGKFMPAQMSRGSARGWSFWNPTIEGANPSPRIFFTRQSALNARAAWAAGEWRARTGSEPTSVGFLDFQYGAIVPRQPAIPRNPADLEVLEATLS